MTSPSHSSRIERLLWAHGASPVAARVVITVAERLRRRALRTGNEAAAMVNAESGAMLGGIIDGAHRRTDIRPHLDLLAPDQRYMQLHTHPGSSAHSDIDGMLLAAHHRIQAMVVIGINDTWFLLSRAPGAPIADVQDVETAWSDALITLRSPFAEQVRARSTSREEAFRHLTHSIWQAIAPALGFRYDRIEREERQSPI